ncbi:DUF167 domain-containing protein [Chloroflexota bacterium]
MTNQARISLKVHPNAARNEITGLTDQIFQVRISAPPIKGKANKELITFLSRTLGISLGSLTITKGAASRNKLIAIDGMSQEEVTRRLSTKVPSTPNKRLLS